MSSPLLSVTVTNYNYARFLDQNLLSIRDQTFDDFELIVIDNASTDGSLDVIRRHADADPRVRVVAHVANQGMHASLRESVDLCRGRYRVHVDADDYVRAPDAFAVQVASLEQHKDMAFTYTPLTMVDPDGDVILASRPFDHDLVITGTEAIEPVLGFTLCHTGMMFRLDAYKKTAGYPNAYTHACDMLLAARLCAVGDVGYINRDLYGWRVHGDNLHLEPQLNVVRDEIMPIIEETFAGFGDRVTDPSVRRRVTRRALVHLPTQYVFSGYPGVGWRQYWESAKLHPFETVVQKRTLALVGRTILGDRAYRAIVGPLRSKDSGLPAEAEPVGELSGDSGAAGLPGPLGLRRGDLVEVRSAEEILATLDEEGRLNALPFMAEMIAYCGRRVTVDRRADKICDTMSSLKSRRIDDAVFLADLRCDGSGHGGCQAECRFYWHESWLKRIAPDAPVTAREGDDPEEATAALRERVAGFSGTTDAGGVTRYRCQATEMRNASRDLSTFAPGPYLNEWRNGDVSAGTFVRVMARAAIDQPRHALGRRPFPLTGPTSKTPHTDPLGLQPGEWVRVKSAEEIRKTLTDQGRNRGLWFDWEMLPFCGGTYRVRQRVTRIIEERTGKMLELTRDCVRLEGVVCSGERSTSRWFCPREIPCYWREAWLERVPAPAEV
jgi:glycosyltransferase involved in cell wall biosynthesis